VPYSLHVGVRMEHGHYTAEMGAELETWIHSQDYSHMRVYYDHGKRGMSKVVPFFGRYSRASTLAFVDCAVVDTVRRKAIALCEIEEHGASPKKVIGDVCNLLMAEWLCIGGQRYSFDDAYVILGVCVNTGGQSEEKAKAICRRARRMATSKRLRGLTLRVRTDTDCSTLVAAISGEIERVVRGYAAKAVSTSSRRAAPRRPCRPRTGSRPPRS
jgi:hypothetical protein